MCVHVSMDVAIFFFLKKKEAVDLKEGKVGMFGSFWRNEREKCIINLKKLK